MTAPAVTVALWTPERPYDCTCGYQVRRRGREILRVPAIAWDMLEFIHNDRARRSLTEKMRRVVRKEYELGLQHAGDSRKSYAGTPDFHIWPPAPIPGLKPVHVWIELKRMGENPSADQVTVMTSYHLMGDAVYLVRPCCLLSGTVDVLLCRHFGGIPRSSYAGGDPEYMAWLESADEDFDLTLPATGRRRAKPKEPDLPGHEQPPMALGELDGYAVAMPVDPDLFATFRRLERWFDDAGFPAVALPLPLRFVVGRSYLAVQVSTGLAVAGVQAPRVWRYAAPAAPFPYGVVGELLAAGKAVTVKGRSGEELEQQVEPLIAQLRP